MKKTEHSQHSLDDPMPDSPDRIEPERDTIRELLDEGKTPLGHGGQIRGDQQAQTDEAQFGGVERGTAHRGRDSIRRDKSTHR